jgi:hypothetical protein
LSFQDFLQIFSNFLAIIRSFFMLARSSEFFRSRVLAERWWVQPDRERLSEEATWQASGFDPEVGIKIDGCGWFLAEGMILSSCFDPEILQNLNGRF